MVVALRATAAMACLQVFPAFTYDARTGNLVDETPVTRQAFSGMLVGVAWGIAVAIFVEPLGIGVVSMRWCLHGSRFTHSWNCLQWIGLCVSAQWPRQRASGFVLVVTVFRSADSSFLL